MPSKPTRTRNHARSVASARAARATVRVARDSEVVSTSREIKRDIPVAVSNMLWGRAAGRCAFPHCNKTLSRFPVTKETANHGEKAHIRAFSPAGPRASARRSKRALHAIDNLILLCHDCHAKIDRGDGPVRFNAAVLAEYKRLHERRVEIATNTRGGLTHVVTFGTHVGVHAALPTFQDAQSAVFPDFAPASETIIALGPRDGARRDHDSAFWQEHCFQLEQQYERKVRVPLEQGDISHVSVFALAPQPLLIKLGTLLGDITPASVFQLHREPPSWAWPREAEVPDFNVGTPTSVSGEPAVVLALSATITADRIRRVLGDDVSIWSITVPAPHQDIAASRMAQRAFRRVVRALLDRIKASHGHRTPIHVFPAMPLSLAIELGRVRMPKADAPWKLYDENTARGGFAHAFTLDAGTNNDDGPTL